MTHSTRPPSKLPARPKPPSCGEAVSRTMIGHFATRLEIEAGKAGGSLNAAQIRDLAERFLEEESHHFQPVFRRAYDQCSHEREARMWEETRRHPFTRILIKRFAHLFPARTGDDGAEGGQAPLSRRLIPGFDQAVVKIIGPALYDQCQRKCQAVIDRVREDGKALDWERIYADADAKTLADDILVVVAHTFAGDFQKRRKWFLTLVNSSLAPVLKSAPDAGWTLTEIGFTLMMEALFADLLSRVKRSPGNVRARYGEQATKALAEMGRLLGAA